MRTEFLWCANNTHQRVDLARPLQAMLVLLVAVGVAAQARTQDEFYKIYGVLEDIGEDYNLAGTRLSDKNHRDWILWHPFNGGPNNHLIADEIAKPYGTGLFACARETGSAAHPELTINNVPAGLDCLEAINAPDGMLKHCEAAGQDQDIYPCCKWGCWCAGGSKWEAAGREEGPHFDNMPFHIDSLIDANNDGYRDMEWGLSCCDNARDYLQFDETWSFVCDYEEREQPSKNLKMNDQTWLEGEFYGLFEPYETPNYVFRFARRKTLNDDWIIQCDLPRQNGTYLRGYNLKIWVNEKFEGGSYWRSVVACEAEVDEAWAYGDQESSGQEPDLVLWPKGSRPPFFFQTISVAFADELDDDCGWGGRKQVDNPYWDAIFARGCTEADRCCYANTPSVPKYFGYVSSEGFKHPSSRIKEDEEGFGEANFNAQAPPSTLDVDPSNGLPAPNGCGARLRPPCKTWGSGVGDPSAGDFDPGPATARRHKEGQCGDYVLGPPEVLSEKARLTFCLNSGLKEEECPLLLIGSDRDEICSAGGRTVVSALVACVFAVVAACRVLH